MSTKTLQAIVLAAGKGTRLKSETPKVLHQLFGKTLLERSLNALKPVGITEAYVVIGHGKDAVKKSLNEFSADFKIETVVQEPQLGTGHAIQQVKQTLKNPLSEVLITYADIPLLSAEALQTFVDEHRQAGNQLTVMATDMEDPTGYGRVIRKKEQVERIVEEKDASPGEKEITLINAGIYCMDWQTVSPLLDKLSADNAQKEFYLTDLILLANQAGLKVGMGTLANPMEITGINDRVDLAVCTDMMNQDTLTRLMSEGVTIIDPENTMIAPEVCIGADTVVYPGCYLEGDIAIGKRNVIGPHTTLRGNVTIGNNSSVVYSLVSDSDIGDETTVGPFAHVRGGSKLSDHVRVGNFVEVKNTAIAHHSNAAHLAYLGDAKLGSEVNMGAGSITANYDPIRDEKHETIIEDGVKVGCNSVLVAPVKIGDHACVAAGSVITKDVAPWDLAIARPKQADIKKWVSRFSKQKAPR